MALDRGDARLIAQELANLNRGSRGGGGGNGAGLVDGVTSSIGSFGEAIKKSVPSLYDLESKYKSTVEKIGASLDTWRELSKTGVNFGNDILSMQTAAKGARMELGDFNEIVSQNRASLAGWGGSIDKGAKDFARVSKQMFDEYTTATDSLRQLGYTNKDLNEVLALQMSAIGTSMADGKAKDEAAIKAATELATEMDLMAKMTGKTREEQMEAQKKLQMDQAFQAKMALETQGMDEKQALEYTTKMKEEYAKAEAQGLGQVFKEQFLYGTVVTKEASMQLVSSGKAGLAVSEQAKAAAEGNFKVAAEKSKEAYAEAAKMAKDPAALQMRVISGITGDFGAATAKFAKESEALAKGIEGLRKKIEQETGKPVTTEQASEAYRDQARKDQKNVPPTTATVVNVEQRAKDAASAFQSGFVDPLIKQSYPAIEKFNKELVGAKGALTEFIKGAEAAGKGGFNAANSGKASKDVPLLQQPTYKTAQVQDAVNRGVAGETKNQYDKRKGTADEAPKKELGGIVPGTVGGTTVTIGEKGKPEAILPLDKLDSMLKSNGKAGNIPGIDLSKIGNDIKTTTSKVEVINWPKEITELKNLTPVQTQPSPAPAEAKKEDKQPQADTAFQEKMLLETRNMNEKDAAEYKKKIAEQYAKAEAAGVGKEFREFIVNGKELSKEAQDKIAAATIQSNKDTAVKSAEAESKKAEAKVEAYTIKAGDNLSKIAKAAGVSIADIMKANPQIKDPNKIFAGAKIEIPGIKKEEANPAEIKKAADDEAAIAREDLASLEAARAKNQKEVKEEPSKKVSNDIKDVVPVNEFAGLDEAIGEQMLQNMELGPKYSEQVSTDINENVPSMGATDAEMKSVEAQDNIDKAIARQKEAQKKLNDLLMGASEEDIGEQYELYAQQLSEANENLAKVVDESMIDLVSTVKDSSTDYSDSLSAISDDINNALPNEFDGVDEAIGGQMLENMDLGEKSADNSADKVMSDIKDALPGTTDGEMKSVEAQDNIDKAIARQKEAQQKLNDLLMGASEEDIGEQYEFYAQQLSEANENLAKVVDESMSDLVGTVKDSSTDYSDSLSAISEDINKALPDEFGKLDEAIGEQMLQNMELGPKYSEQQDDEFGNLDGAIAKNQADDNAKSEPKDTLDRSKISFGKISKIDPKTGLPVMADPKKDDKALPKVENKTQKAEEEKKAADAKKAEEAKQAEEAKKTGDGSKPSEEKTLNDVVKTLEKLNTAMEKLIAVNNANTSLMRDQIKATKTSGTRNLYEVT